MSPGFDAVVIDCPPRLGDVTRSALMAADLALCPVSPGPADVWALADTLDLVKGAQTLRPDLQAATVLNRRASRAAIGGQTAEVLDDAELPRLATWLGFRVAYQEAPVHQA